MAENKSRHELKIKHRQVVNMSRDLREKYAQMRDMVNALDDGFIESKGKSGLAGRQNLTTEIVVSESRPLMSGKKLSKLSQLVRKVEKMCGLDTDPVEDEDVMSNERLKLKIAAEETSIRLLNSEFSKTLHAFETLRSKYSQSKDTCIISRYFAMKAMIRETLQQTDGSKNQRALDSKNKITEK